MKWLEIPNPVPDVQSSFITDMAVPMGDTYGSITLTPASGAHDNAIWYIGISLNGTNIATCSLRASTPELAKSAAIQFLWNLGNQFRQTSFDLGVSAIQEKV